MTPIDKAVAAAAAVWVVLLLAWALFRPAKVTLFVALFGGLLLALFTIPIWKILFSTGLSGLIALVLFVWLIVGAYQKYLR